MDSYGIAAISIGALLVLALSVFLIRKHRGSETLPQQNNSESESAIISVGDKTVIDEPEQELPLVSFQPLLSLSVEETSQLVEIKDRQLISRIDGVVPGAVQLAANAGAIAQYNQALNSAGQLYQAIIPGGAKLAQSKNMGGAVRGFFFGNKGIGGQADFIPVNSNMGKGLAAMNVANAVMGIGSMVVGQYYMHQINNRLDSMSRSLDKIAGFQENEYSGKIANLVIEVQKEAQFQLETMESDELRKRKLIHLQTLEHECGQLLEQANSALHGYNRKHVKDYDHYKALVSEANLWYQSQQVLLKLLSEIGELIYVMNLGAVSKESSSAIFNAHFEQSSIALQRLNAWHRTNISRFEIDVDGQRRKRQGFDGFIMTVPAVFDHKLKYRQMSSRTVANIQEQMQRELPQPGKSVDLFQEDVRLVSKEGRLYYLPNS